jgi:dihydroorotase
MIMGQASGHYGKVEYPVNRQAVRQRILITGGRVIDPESNVDAIMPVALEGGLVAGIGGTVPAGFVPEQTINASGMLVVPGLVDMHVHLREPGREDKETIATGTQAAAGGGFTAVACMPNTMPALDEESKIRYVVQRSETCPCRVFPIGAITENIAGEKLAPFGEMVGAGAKAFSDDGKSVKSSYMMRNALNYSRSFSVPIICHCEDHSITENCHMNESAMSTKLGLRGIPCIAEEIIVARDIMIAEYTGARVHIAHVTTAGAVRIIREAKLRGVKVSCETCPHYFVFTDENLETYDTDLKMNPPLRTPADRKAVIEGLADGTIDVIASDHAPHCTEEKDVEFAAAAFGVVGLETSLSAVLTYLVAPGILTIKDMVRKMSVAPRQILNIGGGNLKAGLPADITIINPSFEWTVDSSKFYSKGRNTPFKGLKMKGAAAYTIMDGRVVFERC